MVEGHDSMTAMTCAKTIPSPHNAFAAAGVVDVGLPTVATEVNCTKTKGVLPFQLSA